MDLITGIILVSIGFILNQWISHSLGKDEFSRPMFLNYPAGVLIPTIAYVIIYIIGLYFLYKVSLWIPIVLLFLFSLLIVTNLSKNRSKR